MINTVMISSKIKDKGILAINNANLFFFENSPYREMLLLENSKEMYKDRNNKIRSKKLKLVSRSMDYPLKRNSVLSSQQYKGHKAHLQ